MPTPSVSQEQVQSRVAVMDGSAGTQTSEGAGSAPIETIAAPAEHPAAPHEPVAKVAAPPAGAASPPSTEASPAEKEGQRKNRPIPPDMRGAADGAAFTKIVVGGLGSIGDSDLPDERRFAGLNPGRALIEKN